VLNACCQLTEKIHVLTAFYQCAKNAVAKLMKADGIKPWSVPSYRNKDSRYVCAGFTVYFLPEISFFFFVLDRLVTKKQISASFFCCRHKFNRGGASLASF
jgi:hypothetical protein